MLKRFSQIRKFCTVLFPAVMLHIHVTGETMSAVERHASSCVKGGMVVTACPIATSVGREILLRGGNSVDAAVAIGFALAVTYPAAGNIGGGGFMLVRLENGETTFIDYREKAPLAATEGMYLDGKGGVVSELSILGHLSAGVPGSVAGMYLAHTLYGELGWDELMAPAIRLASEGFTVSGYLAGSLKKLERYTGVFPGLDRYMRPDGSPLRKGDRLKQPELALTLDRIALHGPVDFYEGETAKLIIDEMRRGGGIITGDDLRLYRAVTREPVTGTYRSHKIISAPPPSSGGTILIEILNILEGYPLYEYGRHSVDAVHVMAEAEKRAYADRAEYLGDADFVEVPLSDLMSKSYASRLRSTIHATAVSSDKLRGGGRRAENEQTTHYSIIDPDGNAVAVTTTLNGSCGSKVVVEGAGFLLNNEMDDFSIKPGAPNMYGLTGSHANAIVPEKRMLSSMTPTIVLEDERVKCILGTPGGSTIITTVAQILVNIIDFEMDPAEAVKAGRFHHQWFPDHITFEEGSFPDSLIISLREREHTLKERKSTIGNAQMIYVTDSLICGYSDPRGCGSAAGIDSVAEAAD